MSDLTFDKWIEHDGNGCPVPLGYVVDVEVLALGCIRKATAVLCCWRRDEWDQIDRLEGPLGEQNKFLRYRIHKPKGMEAITAILANLPVPSLPRWWHEC